MNRQAGAIIEGPYRSRCGDAGMNTSPVCCSSCETLSSPDATHDDPTLRRCLEFAQQLQAGSVCFPHGNYLPPPLRKGIKNRTNRGHADPKWSSKS